MIVTLTNNLDIPIHWNDVAYEADCAECGRVVYGKTLDLIRQGIEQHSC